MSYNTGPKIVTDGLVCCLDAADRNSYPGTGSTWYDLSGNGNHGTLTNGVTFNSSNGGSLVFDGTNDHISTTYDAITGQNPLTLSIWYKSDLTQNKNLLGWGSTSCFQLWDVLLYGNKIGVHLYCSSNEAGITYTNNIWQNIVFTYAHPTITSYMDGVYGASYSNVSINTGSTYDLNIGKGIFNSYAYFDGNISNITMYNRSLSADEVRRNYNATKGRFGL